MHDEFVLGGRRYSWAHRDRWLEVRAAEGDAAGVRTILVEGEQHLVEVEHLVEREGWQGERDVRLSLHSVHQRERGFLMEEASGAADLWRPRAQPCSVRREGGRTIWRFALRDLGALQAWSVGDYSVSARLDGLLFGEGEGSDISSPFWVNVQPENVILQSR